MGDQEEVLEGEAEPRFSWLPLVPWAIVLALGIAALSVAHGHDVEGVRRGAPAADAPAGCREASGHV
jgi:uncharacterized membrane protein